MHIEIRGHVKATAAIRRHIERRVQTAVGRRSPVVVEEVHADLYLAVSQAAERMSQTVRRELDRLRHPRVKSSATAS
jgi:ribosome-associated translation inhibitor RaiA